MTEANRGTEIMNLFPAAFYATKSTSMNSVEFSTVGENEVSFTCTCSNTGRPLIVTIKINVDNFAIAKIQNGKNIHTAGFVPARVITQEVVEDLVMAISNQIDEMFFLEI